MRREREMGQRLKIGLREIEDDGDFLCPTCKQVISLYDETGMTYGWGILEIITKHDGTVWDATIQCKRRRSILHLERFDLINEIGCADELLDSDDHLNIKGKLQELAKMQKQHLASIFFFCGAPNYAERNA